MAITPEMLQMQKDALALNEFALDQKIDEESDSTSDASAYLKHLKEKAKEQELELELASLDEQEEENELTEEEKTIELSKKMLAEEEEKERRSKELENTPEPIQDSSAKDVLELKEKLKQRNITSRVMENNGTFYLETDLEGDLKVIDPTKTDFATVDKILEKEVDKDGKEKLMEKYTSNQNSHDQSIENKYINPEIGSHEIPGITREHD